MSIKHCCSVFGIIIAGICIGHGHRGHEHQPPPPPPPHHGGQGGNQGGWGQGGQGGGWGQGGWGQGGQPRW